MDGFGDDDDEEVNEADSEAEEKPEPVVEKRSKKPEKKTPVGGVSLFGGAIKKGFFQVRVKIFEYRSSICAEQLNDDSSKFSSTRNEKIVASNQYCYVSFLTFTCSTYALSVGLLTVNTAIVCLKVCRLWSPFIL